MKKITCFILFTLLFFHTALFSQSFERIVRNLEFTEGPVFNAAGNLLFSDVPAQRIYQYDQEGNLSVFLENTGGANGLFLDAKGNIIACAGDARQLIRISPEGDITVLVDSYDGKKLNSPNDLWIDPEGGIYFTDPRYGSQEGMEQDGMYVYYFQPSNGKLTRVIDDMTRPNGIIGTSDGKALYVVDEGKRELYRYNIAKPGKLEGKTFILNEGVDGMSVDDKNNIYITAVNVVIRYDPVSGEFTRYSMDVMPTNVVWHKGVIYVTTQTGEVYRKKLE